MLKRNYHTHTPRCQHAEGREEEYVRAAIGAGFAVLGFSDHTPWPYKSSFVSGMRMRMDQFADYKRTVLDLRAKYAGQIEIPLGLECEAFPEYTEWLRDFKAEHLDYILLGNHYDYTDEGDHRRFYPAGGFYFGRCTKADAVIRYGERTLAGMATGLYDYIAHPDLFMNTYPEFDADCRAVSRDLCQAAKALNMPLEFNLLGADRSEANFIHGFEGYPCPGFWEIAAETGCRAIIGFDAHRPDFLTRDDLYDDAREALKVLGMEVVEKLELGKGR